MVRHDRPGRRPVEKLATALIFIGSLLGMMSGALILQGNPSNCSTPRSLPKRYRGHLGTALEDVSGDGVENVSVELLDATTKAVLDTTATDAFGYFSMSNVQQSTYHRVLQTGLHHRGTDICPR